MAPLFYDHLDTTIGVLTIICSEAGVRQIRHSVTMKEADSYIRSVTGLKKNSPLVAPIANQIKDYLNGKLQQWDIALDLEGHTEFQNRIWRELLQIPYGSTISYSELALRSNSAKAVRAAGSACGKNPIPLIIPCHRILAKNGKIGGFAWGSDVKSFLLNLEAPKPTARAA